MASLRRFMMMGIVFLVLALCVFLFVNYYSFLFSRKVVGVVQRVERIQMNLAVLQTQPNQGFNPQIYSFAVAIKESATGEIVTASAEDRQWAVVEIGKCAEAVFYPYPPWQLDKANTYYGARLEKLYECPTQP